MELNKANLEIGNNLEILYKEAIKEHPEYLKYSQDEIRNLISDSLSDMSELEQVGENYKSLAEVTPAILKNITAVWIISGPGTYDLPTKEDKYKNFDWARGMDRQRLNHGTILARRIAEAKSGQKPKGALTYLPERKQQIKDLIAQYGPEIIYNGTKQENSTALDVLSRSGIIIPQEKVHIISGDIKTTLDQIKTFRLPSKLNENEELAIVSHAPHLVRIMHMLNKHRPFPEGTKVRLFPVPTPRNGKIEYSNMETLGILRYIYLEMESTVKSYPYSLSSEV